MNRIPIIFDDLKFIYHSNIRWEAFANKTVLITGANGFLPAYMVETLLFANQMNPHFNIRVIALVRNFEKARQRFKYYEQDPHLHFIVQDISQPIELTEKVDYIIHAASQASPKYYGTDPVGTLGANVLGTINMMKLAEKNAVDAFLYFSSGEVYGQLGDEYMPVREDNYGYVNPTQVRSCYAESKRMGENICVSWHHQYGIKAKIVRPFHTYGPRMLLDDGRVYADFVSDILSGRNIIMKSDGKAKRAFCYLADATVGFFTVLLKGQPAEAYNIGNPHEEHSIIDLAKTLAGLYPEKNVKVVEVETQNNDLYLKSPISRSSPNIEKVKTLGWNPSVSVKDGFKRTIESYRSHV